MNLQEGTGGKAKTYQIQQLLKAVDRWHTEQGKKAELTTGTALSALSTRKRKSPKKR